MKLWKLAVCLLLAAPFFTSCDDDNNDVTILPTPGQTGALYVLQGGWGQNNAALGQFLYDEKTGEIKTTTKVTPLGDTPQNMVVTRGNLFVAVNGTNSVDVYDGNQLTVRLASIPVKGVQSVATDGRTVYAVGNDSAYAIDTREYKVLGRAFVGKNPYASVVANGSLYVNVSGTDGTWANDGNYVAKVRLVDFGRKEPQKIQIADGGVNPYNQIVADINGNVYTVAAGNFGNIPARVYKVSGTQGAVFLGEGGTLTVSRDQLYVGDNGKVKVYDTKTDKLVNPDLLKDATDKPTGFTFMAVNPFNGKLYLSSSWTGATAPSAIYEYSKEGKFIQKKEVGPNPYFMIFF